jgi:GDP-L-fucose synthase
VYVAGPQTVVGAALVRRLARDPAVRLVPPAEEPDLCDRRAVLGFFERTRPDRVVVAAGKSGGISANVRFPVDLMHDNLLVATHLLEAAHRTGVSKLLYLASSCSYPRACPQPMRPEALGTGPLEPTNEAYATAKLAGMVLTKAYRQQFGAPFVAGIPANPFGPGDDFDDENAHVIGALLRRMHLAKERGDAEVVVWGTGRARREFVYNDDLADACLVALEQYDGDEPLNLGGGPDVSIGELAEAIARTVGFRGRLTFDVSRPDGMPLKGLEGSPLAALGWKPATPLAEALRRTYEWFLESGGAGG